MLKMQDYNIMKLLAIWLFGGKAVADSCFF